MQFKTPAEYRKHMRELIPDDYALVEQVVRRKFPVEGGPISGRKLRERSDSKPKRGDSDYFCPSNKKYLRNMAKASRKLAFAVIDELAEIGKRYRSA